MKQMIKFEVKRMLRNPGFYIAMMIGLIVSAAHWIVGDRFKFCVNYKS